MKMIRLFPLAGLLLLLSVGHGTAEAQDGFSDSFHSTSLDSTLWSPDIQDSGAVDPQTDGLHMTLASDNSAPSFYVSVNSRCVVHGDFDVQVEYRLVTWPPGNGISLGLAAGSLSPVQAWVQRVRGTDGREFYMTYMTDGVQGTTETTDGAGRLRLTRTGDTVTGYFFSSGSWVFLHSYADPQYAVDTWFGLLIAGFNSTPGVEVVLENFSVTADAVTCPGPFTPTYSLTLDEVAPDDFNILPVDDECPVGAPCKAMYSLDIPDGQPSAGVLVRHPGPRQELGRDVLVPDGAVIGHFEFSRRVGPWGSCASGSVITSQGDDLDATTDPNTTTGSPADLVSFSHWPTQLDGPRDDFFAAFPDAVLVARSVGSPATIVTNTLVYRLTNGDIFHQPLVGDPTVPPAEEICGPVTLRSVQLGLTADNPDTPQDEGGIPLGTCVEPGVVTYTTLLDRGDTPPGDWVPYDDTAICSPNTPTGDDVSVPLNGGTEALAGIDVTFSEITGGGSTTVVTTTAGPPPPTGFKIVGLAGQPLYFDINTDAAYSGDLTVCMRYDETQVAGPEANLKLMQRVDGFVNVTTSVDTVSNIICGTTTHLSIFIVAEASVGVGGIVDIRVNVSGSPVESAADSSGGSSGPNYVAIAGLTAPALIILILSVSYARRRWLR